MPNLGTRLGTRDEPLTPEARDLFSAIDARRDELVDLVAELVRRPSELGQEAPAQAYVADHLGASGLVVDVWESDESLKREPGAGDPGIPFSGRPNVAGLANGRGGGRSLILNGHIDVVSPEPVDDWTSAPWEPTVVGDRMYGRGAYDMKSGIALNLFLPRLLRDLGIRLAGDLIVHSVIEEECTGNGALDASRRHRADAAVVTEPMDGDFVHAHVGVLWFKVVVEGKAAHAAFAPDGVNAITRSVPVIRALEALDRRLNETQHPAFAGIAHPVGVNIGVITGGDWPSTLAGRCELQCRLGFYPDQTVEQMRGAVEAAMRAAAAGDDWLAAHPPRVSYSGHHSPGSTVSLDEPFVRLLADWHRRVSGEEMATRAGTGTLDMRYYNFAGVPSGCYGAAGDNAHAADEWLDLASLAPAAKVLGGFLLDWCGSAG